MKCQVTNVVKYQQPALRPSPAASLISREFLRSAIMQYLEMDWPNVSSCTSAVIDAKIEQAMDRVKNHLTYILQEEVESLKGHIDVLLDRVKQLEMENNLLKANPVVSPQTSITAAIELDKDMQTEDMEVAAITANANFCTGF